MPRTLRIPVIPDTHWGAVPSERLEAEYRSLVLPWLAANEFDALIHTGDWFDCRLSLDSKDSKAAGSCMFDTARLCEQRSVPFRVLQGTLTHDHTQLENYRPLEVEFSHFRLVLTTAHEELLPGFDVLFMPEVYPPDYGEHYDRFLRDGDDILVYDAIFGHGEIDVAAGWGEVVEGERFYMGTPTHSAELLLQHSSGPVQFGHIHKRFRYKGRLGYGGSLTRWCHGEPEVKGFDVLTLTEKSAGGWRVDVSTVANPMAPEYRAVMAEEILSVTDPSDEMVRKIREAASRVHRLRVRFSGFPIGIEEFSVVRGALAGDPSVEIVALARPAPPQGEGAAEAQPGAAASYLRDSSVPAQERLHRFIAERNGGESPVTLEQITELTAPLSA